MIPAGYTSLGREVKGPSAGVCRKLDCFRYSTSRGEKTYTRHGNFRMVMTMALGSYIDLAFDTGSF